MSIATNRFLTRLATVSTLSESLQVHYFKHNYIDDGVKNTYISSLGSSDRKDSSLVCDRDVGGGEARAGSG